MPHLPFALVDVFATEPLSGNPLAVVDGGATLDDGLMGRIAREFNQSETTFLLPPTTGDALWRLRSFTPIGAEVFGAGHNALGAWWWLAEQGRLPLTDGANPFAQEIGPLVLPLTVQAAAGRPIAVVMEQAAPEPGRSVADPQALAAALGLAQNDLDLDTLPAQVVSTGAGHLMIPVRHRDAVDAIRVDAPALLACLQAVGGEGAYVFSRDPRAPGAVAYARFFNPTMGISEDPATGTAAGPLACHLVAHGLAPAGQQLVIEQGTAMGRTSLIGVRVTAGAVEIIGGGVTVAEGTLRV
jgi:trans-2,3-dihydro-3-hydroxyanthranilate isomerase